MTPHAAAGYIPISQVQLHPANIRTDLGDLRTLTRSITTHGVLVPIICEKRGTTLRLRDGHRRLVAADLAGLTRIPAIIHAAPLDDDEWIANAVQVNTHRRGLDTPELRDAAQRLLRSGWTRTHIADTFGVTPATVARLLRDPDGDDPADLHALKPARKFIPVRQAQLAHFIDQWRTTPDATANDILDALSRILEGREVS